MNLEDPHFRREDRESKWRRIAGHIEAYPDHLAIALDNLDRWEELGRVHPGPIREWRERIMAANKNEQGLRELIHFLASPNHDSETLKSCSPFVGLPIDSRSPA